MLRTVVDPKAVAIQISIYICACVSYSTEDEEVEDDWSLGGVRGPCKRCECMKWGTVVALFGFTAGLSFYFLFLGAGLVLGREPPRVCLDAPHTPQAPITRRVALSVYIHIYIYT